MRAGGQEGSGGWLEREARRPEGPRRGKEPEGLDTAWGKG